MNIRGFEEDIKKYRAKFWIDFGKIAGLLLIIGLLLWPLAIVLGYSEDIYIVILIWILFFTYVVLKHNQNLAGYLRFKNSARKIYDDYKNGKLSKREANLKLEQLELKYLKFVYNARRYVRGAPGQE